MIEEKKPLIIEMEEAKIELAQCVNEILRKHGLNCYLIEPFVEELYTQIKMGAQNELAQVKAQMNAVQKEGCGQEGCECGRNTRSAFEQYKNMKGAADAAPQNNTK